MRMLIAVGARRCTTPRASRPSAAFRPSSSSTPRSAFLPPAPMPSPHISSFTQACPSHSRSPEMHAWMMVRCSGTQPAAPPEPTRLPKALASYRPLPSPRGRASGSAREVSHLAARCVVRGAAVPWRHCHTRRRAALGKARCGRGRGSCGCPRQGLSLSGLSCPASLTCGARCADCGSDPGGAGEARGHGQGDPPEVGPRHQARLRPRPVNSPRRIAPPLPSFPSTSQQPATGRLRLFRPGLPGRPPARPLPSAHCTTARRLHCFYGWTRALQFLAQPRCPAFARVTFPNHNMPKHTVRPKKFSKTYTSSKPHPLQFNCVSCAAIAYYCIAAADSPMSPINKIKGIEQHTTGD